MNMQNKIVKRKMLFAERLMHVDNQSSIILKLCLMIKGHIDEDNFRLAISKLQRKYPQLRMRIEGDYFVFDDNVPPVTLQIFDRKHDRRWKEVMEADLKIPIDHVHGPMIRFIWVRSPELSEIMIITTHTIMDGVSIMNLMKELVALIDDPEKEVGVYEPILSLEEMLPGVKISWWEKLLAQCLIPPVTLLFNLSLIGKKKKPIEYCELEWHFIHEEVTALKKIAKKHSVQPNTLLCIIMAKAFMKYYNPERKKRKIFMSVDIRRYIPTIKRDMMFSYAPMLTFDIDFDSGNDYWELTRKFSDELIYKAVTDPKTKIGFTEYPIPEATLLTEEMHSLIKPIVKRNQSIDTGQDFNFINLGLQRYSTKNRLFEVEMMRGGNNMPWYNPNLFYVFDINGQIGCNITVNTHLISEEKCLKIRDEFIKLTRSILEEEV